MIAAIQKHKGKLLGLVVLILVGAVLFNSLTCVQGSGMVVMPNAIVHECKYNGMQVTLYDHRPSDGDAKFLCLGIPE